MGPLMLLALVFGMVTGFVMGWIGGRIYGRHEGRAAVLRERATAPLREPVPAAPQAAPSAGPVVLMVQNQSAAPATPTAHVSAAGYSHQLAELAMHLAAEQARRLPDETAAVGTGHILDDRPVLDGEVA